MPVRTIVLFLLALLLLAACATREQTGTAVGAGTGAVVGSEVGDGTAGTLVGAIAGGLLGRQIGQWMDERDREEVAQTLEYQPSGETTAWVNPDTGREFRVTPTETYVDTEQDRPCRRFRMAIDGEVDDVQGTACRVSDGRWEIVDRERVDSDRTRG